MVCTSSIFVVISVVFLVIFIDGNSFVVLIVVQLNKNNGTKWI